MVSFQNKQMMKHLSSINISIMFSAVLFLLYFSFSSCKKTPNPYSNRNEKDTIVYDMLKTIIHVQFIDANTNEYIIPEEGKNLKVMIVGKSNDAVADIIGLQRNEYNVRQGTITFCLLPEAEFVLSPGSPVCFTIVAKLNDYLTSTKEVTITGEGDYMLKIFMVNMDDPPPGVIIEKLYGVGNLANGMLLQTVSIATTNSEAIVVIPAGTKLLDSDSIDLAGKLNITLAYYSNMEDNALSAFPGGITGTVMENNSSNSGVFFPAGSLTIEISDSDWHKAAIIENNSLEISMVIDYGTYNPVSGSNIINGDSIQLFSYLSDTGLWMFDQWAHVSDTIYNRLYTSAKTSNLDIYNFSWFEKNNCNQGSKFEISGSCQQCSSIMLEGVVRKQVDNTFVSSILLASQRNEPASIPFSTGGTPVYIEWGQGNECNYCFVNPAANPLLIDDMCSQQLIELPLTDNGPMSMSITANFIGNCVSDTNIIVLPSFGVWIRPVDASCWRWSSMKSGVAQICDVIYGETYVLGTYYNGTWQEWKVTITEETTYTFKIKLSNSVCSEVFGIL